MDDPTSPLDLLFSFLVRLEFIEFMEFMEKPIVKPITPRRKNSRQKGAAGEREFAHVLITKGLNARRGQQFAGGGDSPDVVCTDLTNVHFEVKRVEASKVPYEWLAQACRDSATKPAGTIPVVAHRRSKEPWIAILPMDALLDLLILREGQYL